MNLSNFSFSREPAVYIAIVDAALMLAVSFGLPITPEQKGLIDALLGAIGTLFLRSQVTPVASPKV